MGNCIVKESSKKWGGEDLGTSVAREHGFSHDRTKNHCDFYAKTERTSLHGVSSSPKVVGKKVKIRISKKQLSDLLKNADVHGLSAQEVLVRLAEAGDQFEAHRRSSEAPALQSIPE